MSPLIASRSRRRIPSIALVVGLLAGGAVRAQHAPPNLDAATADARRLQLTPGLRLDIWAADPQLLNPVAFSLAPIPSRGTDTRSPGITAYIAETHRYGTSVLDITQNTAWLLDDLSFRSVADRVAFLTRRFGTNFNVLVRESELVRRVADTDGDGRADASSVFADGFQAVADGTAAGVLARGADLWFANIPNLWRFPIPPGGGATGTVHAASIDPGPELPPTRAPHSLALGFGVHIGVTGHDLHGLALGPDGRIYLSFGDRGLSLVTREGTRIHLPDTGGVLRCEHDGQGLELFCLGLRNPQELAFDDLGNLFTSDNDTAGPDDCRVLHLVEGADYGWRASYQHMKGFGPWVREGLWAGGLDGQLPPAGKVSQGPAGLAYYPGTGFGDHFKNRFLHADFPGGIWSFGTRPHGASFAVADREKVVWNLWPTDVEFGPDGALYVLDWVAGWTVPRQGRIYRITDSATTAAESAISRRVLEDLARGFTNRPVSELVGMLSHRDRRIRFEAQFELARRGPDVFRELRRVAFTGIETLPRLHALWAVGQIARRFQPGRARGDFSDELASLLRLLDDADETVAGWTARILAEAVLIHADLPAASMLREGSARLRFDAAMALGGLMTEQHRAAWSLPQKAASWLEEHLPRIGRLASRYVERSILFHPGRDDIAALARTNALADPFLQHAAVRHFERLERLEAGWPSYLAVSGGLRANALDPSSAVRHAALLALRRTTNAFAASLLSDADPFLAVEAARAIHDQPIPDALPALADALNTANDQAGWARIPDLTLAAHLARTGRTWTGPVALPTNVLTLRQQFLHRALDAHFRLGLATNAMALASFAATPIPGTRFDPDRAATARVEALFLLSRWEILPASPGHVPARIVPDPNHGAVPTINPENWPGWFDRLVGLWRPLPPRPANDARRALESVVEPLLADRRSEVVVAAIDAFSRLRVSPAAAPLQRAFAESRTPSEIRRAIPAALVQLGAPGARAIIQAALADADPTVKTAAVPLIEHLDGPDALPLLVRLVGEPAPSGTGIPVAAQAALAAASLIPGAVADDLIAEQLRRLLARTLPPELELETLEAARRRSSPAIRADLDRYEAGRNPANPMSAWDDVLYGGDPARGKAVFFEKTEVQCSRCHRVKNDGGTVGPALDQAAKGRNRQYLLESVIHPNAQVAAGFENIALELSDGRSLAGLVKSEDATHLVLVAGEDGEMRIPRTTITRRQRGLSAMPEGLANPLTRRELRDLVAYLASLAP